MNPYVSLIVVTCVKAALVFSVGALAFMALDWIKTTGAAVIAAVASLLLGFAALLAYSFVQVWQQVLGAL